MGLSSWLTRRFDHAKPDQFGYSQTDDAPLCPPESTVFVTGSARSGTTSCLKILGTSCNVAAFSEPRPRLTREVYDWRHGRLDDPRPTIIKHRLAAIRGALAEERIYIEKDLQVAYWLHYYGELFDGRFVFVRRDGRDCVRSLLDYHYRVNGNMYREAVADEPLSMSIVRESGLPPNAVLTEHTRPRPTPDDPWFDAWPGLSRLQMTAWYWAHTTRVAQARLHAMEPERWKSLDYSAKLAPSHFEDIFSSYSLGGFDRTTVEEMLDSGINSIQAVARQDVDRVPHWTRWPAEWKQQFDEVASDAMVEMGYYPLDVSHQPNVLNLHLELNNDPLQKDLWRRIAARLVDEFTPPISVYLFANEAMPEIDGLELTQHRQGQHRDSRRGQFDVVVGLGVIDRCGDMDQMLVAFASLARHRLVLTASRGHFPDRIRHTYRKANNGSYSNDWCSARSASLLLRHLDFDLVTTVGEPTDDPLRPCLTCQTADRIAR